MPPKVRARDSGRKPLDFMLSPVPRAADLFFVIRSWGLRPRLYAYACYRRLRDIFPFRVLCKALHDSDFPKKFMGIPFAKLTPHVSTQKHKRLSLHSGDIHLCYPKRLHMTIVITKTLIVNVPRRSGGSDSSKGRTRAFIFYRKFCHLLDH